MSLALGLRLIRKGPFRPKSSLIGHIGGPIPPWPKGPLVVLSVDGMRDLHEPIGAKRFYGT